VSVRHKIIVSEMDSNTVYPIDWVVQDEGSRCSIIGFGKRFDGSDGRVSFPYTPIVRTLQRNEAVLVRAMKEAGVRPIACTRSQLRPFVGYDASQAMVNVRLSSPKVASRLVSKLKALGVKPHEIFDSNLHPIPASINIRDSFTAAWMSENGRAIPDAPDMFPAFVIASWDIEAYSSTGAFPQPHNIGDTIICIGLSLCRLGEPKSFRKVVFTWRPCDAIEGVDIIVSDSEEAMIGTFCSTIREHNVDILLAYNSFGFDNSFLFGRVQMLDIEHVLADLARVKTEPGVDVIEMFNAAMGQNEWTLLRTPGRVQIDLLEFVRREYKLERYSLDAVSSHFLNDRKLDVSPEHIFRLWAEGSPSGVATICTYCSKDCELPLRLARHLQTIPAMLEMARATFVPVQWLLTRGQTIKVFSQICRKAWSRGFAVPIEVPPGMGKGDDTSYEGAKVLDANVGLHGDAPVIVLDFASLYPSIMRAFNICPSTMCMRRPSDPENFNEIAVSETKCVWYAKHMLGVVPALLEELALFRKDAKKKMACAKARGDMEAAALFDGRQLAYKISMNSCYGFFGVQRGFLPIVDIAKSVTSKGRDLIICARDIACANIEGLTVVYGDTDSIFCKLPTGTSVVHAFKHGESLARIITESLPPPVLMEFEKTYTNLLLVSKKRYAGLKYTRSDACDGVETKGIQVVRRDMCPFVRGVASGVLDDIIRHGDSKAATERVKSAISDLLANRVDIDDLTLTKRLAKDYKNEKQPQLTVARMMENRKPGGGPSVGERVAYVHVLMRGTTEISQAVEDPVHAKANGVVPDGMYYVTNQLKTPVESILDIAIGDKSWTRLFSTHVQACSGQYKARRAAVGSDRKRDQRALTEFFGTSQSKRQKA
jgi:DNA polymerase delta subunit 1